MSIEEEDVRSDVGAVEGEEDRSQRDELLDDVEEEFRNGEWPDDPDVYSVNELESGDVGDGDGGGAGMGLLSSLLEGGHQDRSNTTILKNNSPHYEARNDGQDDRPDLVRQFDHLICDDDEEEGRPTKKISSGSGTPIPMSGFNGYSLPSNEGSSPGARHMNNNNNKGDVATRAVPSADDDNGWPSSSDEDEAGKRRKQATRGSDGDSKPHHVESEGGSLTGSPFAVKSSSKLKDDLPGYSTNSLTIYGSSSSSLYYSQRPRGRGLTGLINLGNTCFMNSALQCLSNTCPLREYFLSGEYVREINKDNPIGTGGELAKAFGDLLISLWSGQQTSVAPRSFKTSLGRHAEQFMGYDQQDSQELIAYLLDGIHEDLNRVGEKPYEDKVEALAEQGYEQVADRAWDAHLARNDSRVVEIFQGQYKSVITCPMESCSHVSITFDPFMYLSVPVPSNDTYCFPVHYYPPTLGKKPRRYLVRLPQKFPQVKDMRQGLSQLLQIPPQDICLIDTSLTKYYTLLGDSQPAPRDYNTNTHVCAFNLPGQNAAEDSDRCLVAANPDWQDRLAPFLKKKLDPLCSGDFWKECVSILVYGTRPSSGDDFFTDSLDDESIRACQRYLRVMAAAERLKKVESGNTPYVVVVQFVKPWYSWSGNTDEVFEPLVLVVHPTEDDLASVKRRVFRWLKHRWLRRQGSTVVRVGGHEGSSDEEETKGEERCSLRESKTLTCPELAMEDGDEEDAFMAKLEAATVWFRGNDVTTTGVKMEGEGLVMDWLGQEGKLQVYFEVDSVLDELSRDRVYKLCRDHPSVAVEEQKDKKGVNIYDCIQLFMKKEQLEASDMWYCSKCAEHRQAWKEMALWSTPPILVIHLKRFHYSGHYRDKIETMVDFPLEGLDLTPYILDKRKVDQCPPVYDLYAVSNHSGSLHGGHYTAHVLNPFDKKWYNCDDSHLDQVRHPQEEVVSSHAYVLFYRRRDVVTKPFTDPTVVLPFSSSSSVSMEAVDMNHDEEEEKKTVVEEDEDEDPHAPFKPLPTTPMEDEDFTVVGGDSPPVPS